jgi:hypothetical protein
VGLEQGVIARYDTGDGVLRTSDTSVFLAATGTINAGSGTAGRLIITDGPYDDTKEALVGLPVALVRWLTAAGVATTEALAEDFAVDIEDEIALARSFAGAAVTLYTRNRTDWTSRAGEVVHLGKRAWVIRSKWFTHDQAETVKRWNKLDLYFDPVAGGVIFVELYVDHLTTRQAVFRVELDQGMFSLPIDSQFFRMIQFRIKGFGFAEGFKLHSYSFRAEPAEYAERQKS